MTVSLDSRRYTHIWRKPVPTYAFIVYDRFTELWWLRWIRRKRTSREWSILYRARRTTRIRSNLSSPPTISDDSRPVRASAARCDITITHPRSHPVLWHTDPDTSTWFFATALLQQLVPCARVIILIIAPGTLDIPLPRTPDSPSEMTIADICPPCLILSHKL